MEECKPVGLPLHWQSAHDGTAVRLRRDKLQGVQTLRPGKSLPVKAIVIIIYQRNDGEIPFGELYPPVDLECLFF